jgi:digeranylgeranylglycerophospholipid reductase
VLVVGGGPAGLVAAEATAAGGLATVVAERRATIGDPVHTSGATSPTTLRRFEIPQRLYHAVGRLRVLGPSAEAVLAYDEPPLCIIDVRETYRFLAERARAAGAEVRTHAAARAPLLEEGRVVGCELVGGPHAARVVVDASGYRARISQAAGLHPGFRRFGVGAEVELEAPGYPQDEAFLLVGSRYSPAGYGWAFPWGRARVRVGVGVHHADVRVDPRDLLDRLLADADQLGLRLDGAAVTERHFGLVPAERLPRALVGDGIVAVGDAACQATLVAGEGIRLALEAGRLAGTTIVSALRKGRSDREALAPYERSFRRRYGWKLAASRAVNVRLSTLEDRQWDEHVRLLRRMPPELVAAVLQAEFSPALALWILRTPAVWGSLLRVASGPRRG